MKPIQSLLFLCAVGTLSALTAWVFPRRGFEITPAFQLKFASFEKDTTHLEPIQKMEDVTEFLEVYELEIDSTAIKDSIKKAEILRRKELLKIQWAKNDRSSIFPFFESLESLKTKGKKVRIMHYGDSQIEGDRITGKVRNELQKTYGGSGAGLVPAVEAVQNAAIKQSNSDNWNRYTLFGRPDTNVKHNRYGPLFSFGTFKAVTDTASNIDSAWINFETSKLTYYSTRKYKNVQMSYGNVTHPFILKTYVDDSLQTTEIIKASQGIQTHHWHFNTSPEGFRVEFIGKVSPEVYYFSFEPNSGIIVDNVGLRGSSGTLFKKTNSAQLAQFMKQEPIELMILQFGGNSVPYIKSKEEAERYARWFGSQLKFLKKLNPTAAFILIGPSDMSTKIDGKYATYPFLPEVRDALKAQAFALNCGYWDLYEVMGGRNSMISWVEAEKPLAGKDYVHFNRKGTNKVAELFMKALWNEKEEYIQFISPPLLELQTDSTVADSVAIDTISSQTKTF